MTAPSSHVANVLKRIRELRIDFISLRITSKSSTDIKLDEALVLRSATTSAAINLFNCTIADLLWEKTKDATYEGKMRTPYDRYIVKWKLFTVLY